MSVRITLDAFSGRPNPSWELDADAERELRQRLQLATPDHAVVEIPGLGYRGIVFELDGKRLRVFRSKELVDGAVVAAVDSSLERWLLSTAPMLDPALRESIERQL